MDTSTPYRFLDTKGCSYTSTYLVLPQSSKTIHSIYTDASDDACRAQFSQEHDGLEFPIAFLSQTFTDMQRKWSTTEQKAYGVYYAVTKWNCYLQGAEIIICNDHKPLERFLNGKNVNNKVNRWELELATYNITFEWISGTQNKAADCLSRLVKLPHDRQATVQMLTATDYDAPAFNTGSRTAQCKITEDLTPQPKADTVTPDNTTVRDTPAAMPKPLTEDRLDALLQMQRTYPFCKHV